MARPACSIGVRAGIATSLVLLFAFALVWPGAVVSAAPGASNEALRFGLHIGDDLERYQWYVPLAVGLSTGIVPVDIRWQEVEPAPGRFEWTSIDGAVDTATRHGLQVVGVLHYPADLPLSRMSRPGWPSGHVDDWDYFVHRTAVRYEDRIKHWIVVRDRSGERDPFLGAAEAEVDALLAQLTATAVHGAQPDARVFAAAPGADLYWLTLFAARGGFGAVDGLALELNRWPVGPEGLEVVVRDVRQLAAEVDAEPELWVWRFGYPTHVGVSTTPPRRAGVSELEQAVYIVKSYAVLASSGVTTVVWHELVDAGMDANDAHQNFGLYAGIGRRKPASQVYSTMTRMMAGLRYVSPEQVTLPAEPIWADTLPEDDNPVVADGSEFEDAAIDDSISHQPDVEETFSSSSAAESIGDDVLHLDAEGIIAEAVQSGQYVHAHAFADDERVVVVAWTSERPSDGEHVLRLLDGAAVRVYDMVGRRLDAAAPGETPIYIELAVDI